MSETQPTLNLRPFTGMVNTMAQKLNMSTLNQENILNDSLNELLMLNTNEGKPELTNLVNNVTSALRASVEPAPPQEQVPVELPNKEEVAAPQNQLPIVMPKTEEINAVVKKMAPELINTVMPLIEKRLEDQQAAAIPQVTKEEECPLSKLLNLFVPVLRGMLFNNKEACPRVSSSQDLSKILTKETSVKYQSHCPCMNADTIVSTINSLNAGVDCLDNHTKAICFVEKLHSLCRLALDDAKRRYANDKYNCLRIETAEKELRGQFENLCSQINTTSNRRR